MNPRFDPVRSAVANLGGRRQCAGPQDTDESGAAQFEPPCVSRTVALKGFLCCGLQLFVLGVYFCGGSVAESGVEAPGIVERLDVSGDCPAGMCTRWERGSVHQLILQGAEK